MKSLCVSRLVIIASLFALPILAQTGAAPSSCPVNLLKFNAGGAGGFHGMSIRVENLTGKKIVGLTFNAALADATEHWHWLSQLSFAGNPLGFINGTDGLPLREFGWNKEIEPGAAKTAYWDRWDLNYEHGGGVAFVLTSILFADGSRWEDPRNRASCMALWYNNHKKGIASDVVLLPQPLPGSQPLQY